MSQRLLFLIAFLVCVAAMSGALVFQYVMYLDPCPLCIFQRVVVIALGLVFLVALLHNPETMGRKLYGVLTVLVSLVGIGLAGRHVWLQNLPPDQVPECGPGLDYYLDTLPILDVFRKVLSGSGECAETLWSFLGLSIPGWTLVMFIGFLVFGLYLLFTRAPIVLRF